MDASLITTLFSIFVTTFAVILSVQSLVTLMWMLYAWNDSEEHEKNRFHDTRKKPKLGFTALLPARHEENVIKDTIKSIDAIDYPDNLKELIVICKDDDTETIAKAKEAISELGKSNIKILTFSSIHTNKPHALNLGLKKAKSEIVTIFDAEDNPNKYLYELINTEFLERKVDVIQSGVQLINFRSHWFSALNVMEYFFWFKSGLRFFAKHGGITMLGGNTVFFKKSWLKYVGGWDEKCLTEDADIGIRLTALGAKTGILYDGEYATLEETPTSVSGFIKQRTRWDQGFIQILKKEDWKKLPLKKQKLFALYILLSPIIQTVLFAYIPVSILIATTQKIPVWITLLSYMPLYLTLLQVLTYCIGLYTFIKEYKFKATIFSFLRILVFIIPYQVLLAIACFRAAYRVTSKKNSWEKTLHMNNHRLFSKKTLAPQYVS